MHLRDARGRVRCPAAAGPFAFPSPARPLSPSNDFEFPIVLIFPSLLPKILLLFSLTSAECCGLKTAAMTTDPDDVVFSVVRKCEVRTAREDTLPRRPTLSSHSLPPPTSVTGPTFPSLIFKMNESTRVSLISVDCRFVGRRGRWKKGDNFPTTALSSE